MVPISLRVSNKKAFVWDVDDIATLRTRHRVCGLLTGTLPHLSQQNVFLGIPLLLMPEEVVLLVDKGLAVLVDDPHAHHDPSVADLAEWDAQRSRLVEEQLALAEEHEAREALHPDRAMSEQAISKRKEREARKARQQAQTDPFPVPVPSAVDAGPVPDAADVPQTATAHSGLPRNSTASHAVQVPAASAAFEWYTPSAHSFATLAAAREAGIWDYPDTPLQRARCGVFRDLWEQGYFLGGGIKFGGEFLVYPGDPLRYHSHFVASVVVFPTASLRPMEIVAHGRLGTGTKKAHLLCEWDQDNKAVTYYSIEWAGFG